MLQFLRRAQWLCLLALLIALQQQPASAHSNSAATAAPTPDSLQNADGTLDLSTGFAGSLDAHGWRMMTGEDGRPCFVRSQETLSDPSTAASAGDKNWDDQFGPPGFDGAYVDAIAVNGSDVYFGGDFTMAGGITATNIAKWNGSEWSALGSGLDGRVYSIAISGTEVYAGGNFSGFVQKWNGSAWSSVGVLTGSHLRN